MSESMSLNEYIENFANIGEALTEGLGDLADELEEYNLTQGVTVATNIMVQIAQVQALQAIAVGIRDLIEKEN